MIPMRQRAFAVTVAFSCALGMLTACGSAVQPSDEAKPGVPADFTRAMTNAPAVYVLDRVERQRGEPVTTFDHTCQGIRWTHLLSDTVTLHADGTARRVFHILRQKDGAAFDDSRVEMQGQWEVFTQRHYYYFSAGPSISLRMALPGRALQDPYQMRVFGTTGLAMLSSLGGSCPGSPNDGREAEFAYSRR